MKRGGCPATAQRAQYGDGCHPPPESPAHGSLYPAPSVHGQCGQAMSPVLWVSPLIEKPELEQTAKHAAHGRSRNSEDLAERALAHGCTTPGPAQGIEHVKASGGHSPFEHSARMSKAAMVKALGRKEVGVHGPRASRMCAAVPVGERVGVATGCMRADSHPSHAKTSAPTAPSMTLLSGRQLTHRTGPAKSDLAGTTFRNRLVSAAEARARASARRDSVPASVLGAIQTPIGQHDELVALRVTDLGQLGNADAERHPQDPGTDRNRQ